MLLRAKIILPITSPPVEDGAVFIEDGRIRAVGTWRELRAEHGGEKIHDLGECALLPGLINAHCHLDYTDMAGLLPPMQRFSDWITSILQVKAHWSYTDYAASWLRGAHQLLHSGCTTVLDIEAVPELLPDVWTGTPLRVISAIEMTGVKSKRPASAILRDALKTAAALPKSRRRTALSPHAPYSTPPQLLKLTARHARRQRTLVTTHVAESDEEFDMYMRRRGVMFKWLASQRDMADCGDVSPIQHLARCGLLGPNFLAVHANYLADGDAELLSRKESSVVHCPRSHAYFQHRKFPHSELTRAGVNVCLGTDSLATTLKQRGRKPELNLFAEMQTFARNHSGVAPERILEMVTVHAARALGREGQIGELRPGAMADVIAVPCSSTRNIAEEILDHSGKVTAVMIAGEWCELQKR